MNPATQQKLMGVSTATLCTALFKRGLSRQFIHDVRPLAAALPNRVGEADMLRAMPAREDRNTIEVSKNREHPQSKAVEERPSGAALVIDINAPIGRGDAPAFPGELIVGDDEGVVVIPAHPADDLSRVDFAAWRQQQER